MRRTIFSAFVLTGLLLIGAGIVRYSTARDQQLREQAALDRHWNEIQREAAQKRILPGEERPQPAQLQGMDFIIRFVGTGSAFVIGGIAGLILSATRRERRRG